MQNLQRIPQKHRGARHSLRHLCRAARKKADKLPRHRSQAAGEERMNITIYTKSNCPNCTTAKQLLKSKGLEYSERDLTNDLVKQAELFAAYPEARQMPQIFIDGQRVGGLAGLQAALKQVGL